MVSYKSLFLFIAGFTAYYVYEHYPVFVMLAAFIGVLCLISSVGKKKGKK